MHDFFSDSFVIFFVTFELQSLSEEIQACAFNAVDFLHVALDFCGAVCTVDVFNGYRLFRIYYLFDFLLFYVVDCKFQNLYDVVVRKRIKHFFAASSRLHEFVVAKNPELMRYRTDRHIKYRRDVAYAQFVF